MNKEENNFEESLRSKLGNHTVDVSPLVWEKINERQKKQDKLLWFINYLNFFFVLDILTISALAGTALYNISTVASATHIAYTNRADKSTSNKHANESHPAGNSTIIENETFDTKTLITQKGNADKKNIKTHSENTQAIINKYSNSHSNKTSIQTKATLNNDAQPKTPTEEIEKVIENKPEHQLYQVDYIPLMAMSKDFLALTNNSTIFQNYAEQSEIVPSILLSKPKKVIKKEQQLLKKKEQQRVEQEKIDALQQTTANENMALSPSNQDLNLNNQNIGQQTLQQDKVVNTTQQTTQSSIEKADEIIQLDTVYGHKKFKGIWAVDALIGPEIARRHLSSNNTVVERYINRRDSAESIKLGYSALMRINLFLTRNLYFNAGISYAQRREKFSIINKWQTSEAYIDSSKFVTYVDPFLGNVIYKTYDTLTYFRSFKDTVNQNLVLKLLDVPLMIGYKWLGKSSGIAIQGGVMFNLLFKKQGSVAAYNYSSETVQNNNEQLFNVRAGLSICGGISINHRLTDHWDLLIEPHTRYILKPISSSSNPLQQKLFSYGINFGIRYKL